MRYLSENYLSESRDQNGEVCHISLHYPEEFNWAYDVVDDIAETEPDRPAMKWCNPEGEEHVFSFGDMKYWSDKTANVLADQGVRRYGVARIVLASAVTVEACPFFPANDRECCVKRIELGDLDTLRARERADAAAGAVVEGMINRFAVAEAFGLGSHVLRPREQRGDCRDRALRFADRALDAVIETLAVQPLRGKDVGLFEVQCQHFGALLRGDQPLAAICVAFLALGLRELLRILLGAHARSPIASAARTALAAAIPSPDFSLQRIAPAIRGQPDSEQQMIMGEAVGADHATSG